MAYEKLSCCSVEDLEAGAFFVSWVKGYSFQHDMEA